MRFSFKKYTFWIFYPSKISQILVQHPAISYVGGKNISLCFSFKILLVSSFSMRHCADKNNRWFFFHFFTVKKKISRWLPTYLFSGQPSKKYLITVKKKINPPLVLSTFRFSKFPIFRFSNFRMSDFSNFQFSEHRVFRLSDFPIFQLSYFLNTWFPLINTSYFPIFRISDFPIFRLSNFPNFEDLKK